MMMKLLSTVLTIFLLLSHLPASAQSQCVGLTKNQCSANQSCSWRKSSVNKNNVKTKAHCRALPNQAKAGAKKKTTTKAKQASKTKESPTKKTTKEKTSRAKKETKEKAASKKNAKSKSFAKKKNDE